MTEQETLSKIADIIKAGGSSVIRTAKIGQVLLESGHLEVEPDDPFRKLRSRAIEVTDLDGAPTFITVGIVLDRLQDDWIPGITALSPDEALALDAVLRLWEHELRVQLRRLIERGERSVDLPWATVVQMSKVQESYRSRLRLPKHPHGECCKHYEEAHDDPTAAAAAVLHSN